MKTYIFDNPESPGDTQYLDACDWQHAEQMAEDWGLALVGEMVTVCEWGDEKQMNPKQAQALCDAAANSIELTN